MMEIAIGYMKELPLYMNPLRVWIIPGKAVR